MPWRVDSFHVSLGVTGDCAVHLLVEDPGNKQPGIVRWAMAVDGGDHGQVPPKKSILRWRLIETLQWIENNTGRYNLRQHHPNKEQRLLLNAVIITHWDADHWRGVLLAMKADILEQASRKPPVRNPRVSFFRYNASGAPQTVVYCPEAEYQGAPNDRAWFGTMPKTAAETATDFYFVNKKKKTVVRRAFKLRVEQTEHNSKDATILGTNLISRRDLSGVLPQNIANPAALLARNAPEQAGQPGIYVVGASKRVLGSAPGKFQFSGDSSAVAAASFPGDGVGLVDMGSESAKNDSSIACMVIWRPRSGKQLPRLSHYFAGDMHWKQETALMEWAGTTGKRKTTGRTVTSVKLSHHGSKSSTPTELLDRFNPVNVVASVAESYGHPSWELMFYLEGWVYAGGVERIARRPFLATHFPYYLARKTDGGDEWIDIDRKQMSMEVMMNTKNTHITDEMKTKYRGDVARVFTAAGANLVNPVVQCMQGDPSENELRNRARNRISDAWTRLSPVPVTAHAATGATRGSVNLTPTTQSTQLNFFLIESRDDDATDGTAYVCYLGDGSRLSPLGTQAVPPVHRGPRGLGLPSSTALGRGPRTIDAFPQPARKVDRKGLKRLAIRPKSVYTVVTRSGRSSYRPSPGTNPGEGDGDDEPMETDAAVARWYAAADAPPQIGEPQPEPLPDPGLQPPGGDDDDPEPLKEPFYFVCASTVEYNDSPPAEVKQLADSDPLDNFLSTLHLKGLILATKPADKTATTALHAQDEFAKWLALVIAPASQQDAALTVTTDTDDPAYITKFDLATPLLGGARYSSAATEKQLDVNPEWEPGPAGTVPWQNSVVLGLESATRNKGLSLEDVLAPVASRGASLLGLFLLTDMLGDKLVFDVDSSRGARNAVWFDASAGYKTVVRTQYAANAQSVVNMSAWISKVLPGITVDSLTVVTKLTSEWVPTSEMPAATGEWEIILRAACRLEGSSFTGPAVKSSLTLDFAGSELKVTLQFDDPKTDAVKLLASVLDWLARLVGAELGFRAWLDKAGTHNFEAPLLRRVVLTVELGKDGSAPAVGSVTVDLELGVKFGQPDEKVVFLLTYGWSKSGSSLKGSLWCPPPPPGDVPREMLPEYEPHLQFEPISVGPDSKWAACLDLAHLIPHDPSTGSKTTIAHRPDGIPTDVTSAQLTIDAEGIQLEAVVECDPPESNTVPKLHLGRLGLDAGFTFDTKQFALDCTFAAAMYPPAGSGLLPVELRGAVSYDGGSWSASADVKAVDAQGAHLLRFFDGASASAAASLIQHLRLNFLSLEYRYEAGEKGSETLPGKSFSFSGGMSVGKLELDVKFDYTAKDTWSFVADLGASGGTACTVQEIIDSIAGDGSVDLPSCVGDIEVDPTRSASESQNGKRLFRVELKKIKPEKGGREGEEGEGDKGEKENKDEEKEGGGNEGDEKERDLVCTVSANVGPVAFTFLQLRNTAWKAEERPSKRFLRLEVNKLPSIEIPVVGDITQPFDEMYFMWVQDGNPKASTSSPPGFTKAEVESLNAGVLADDPICYKTSKKIEDYRDGDVLVEAGCHFVLVAESKTVLDYVFAKPTPGKVPPPAVALRYHALLKRVKGPDAVVPSSSSARADREMALVAAKGESLGEEKEKEEDTGGGTKKEPFKISLGPLSVSNIGLRFSSKVLSVCLDASVALGPVATALLGLSIDLDFGGGRNLRSRFPKPNDGMSFSLAGMAVALERPPLTVAGGLMRQKLDNGTLWAGGVDVGFKPWSFLAAGAYGEIYNPTTEKDYETAFVFAQLRGPLITLEFATIGGVTAGFGYNSALKLPTVAEVPNFPLLAVPEPKQSLSKGSSSPTLDMLQALMDSGWFTPQDEAFWVAAGFTVTAFQMLQVTAVAVAEWDSDNVRLGLYAVAVADVPSTDSPFKAAHVELGILASVDIGHGVAAFEAQLAPSSFILDPSCHLTGGFALYYWFGNNEHAGDWVFSLGGYHSAFKPPSHYPVPPRLQIQWSLGPVSVTGQAYFALTPNACMAGASLHASLSVGVLYAFFDARADFLLNYKPFSFRADARVAVGVRFALDLLFVTIHISVEITAALALAGPPFQGTAYVDFWVFGFTVHFGAVEAPPPVLPISLPDFYSLVLQRGSPAAAKIPPAPHKFACRTGLLPSTPDASEARLARRRAALSVTASDIARQATEKDDAQVWEVHAGTLSFSVSSVFAVSEVTVIQNKKESAKLAAPKSDTVDIHSRPMQLAAGSAMTSTITVTIELPDPAIEPPEWKLTPVIQRVPRALWDAYDVAKDPNRGSRALLDGKNPTIPLMMGVILTPPPPRLSHDTIPAFDAVASQLQDVLPDPPPLPDSTTAANPAWLPTPPLPPDPKEPARDWERVQKLWKSPDLGAGSAAKAVEAWVACMGWGKGSVMGDVPRRLVDGLQDMYVAAPLVAAG